MSSNTGARGKHVKQTTIKGDAMAYYDALPLVLREAVGQAYGMVNTQDVYRLWQKRGVQSALIAMEDYNRRCKLDIQDMYRAYLRELENKAMDREFGL